jgi:hypothetical protein
MEANYCPSCGCALTEPRPLAKRRLGDSLVAIGTIVALSGLVAWNSTIIGTWAVVMGLILLIVARFL